MYADLTVNDDSEDDIPVDSENSSRRPLLNYSSDNDELGILQSMTV